MALGSSLKLVRCNGLRDARALDLLALYVWRTVARSTGYIVGAVLGLIHGWMYLLLQMEDYVLVAGSLGLFAALATVMYVTRNVDWFRIGQPVDGERPAA